MFQIVVRFLQRYSEKKIPLSANRIAKVPLAL